MVAVDDRRPVEQGADSRGDADLPGLAQSFSGTGIAATVEVTGVPAPCEPALQAAVYRVAQEALTNVLKHSAARQVHAELRFLPERLRLTVSDDGHGPTSNAAETSGQGLVGMQERVAAFGGTLDAGPGPRGGFCVRASIPLSGAATG